MYRHPHSNQSPEVDALTDICLNNSNIDPELYDKYDVQRGLRDKNGKGVLAGLTEISEVSQNKMVNGEVVPCDGQLFYRGINVEDLVSGALKDNRFGFEETAYLLLFGELPTSSQLADFTNLLADYRSLPTNFVRDVIMKAPSNDMMNTMTRSVLTLFSYDYKANDTSIDNVLRQCLRLIAVFPLLAVYGYQAFNFYAEKQSLFIHQPNPNMSTAENILQLLRADSKYTELEARVLDLCLILHADHGGGNNSTFTTHVVTSSGTDTYSAIAAALCSLKGPKHGGANIKVYRMFEDIKHRVHDWNDDEEIKHYLSRLLNKEEFDRQGLIYGIGHAVYTISDPRARLLKSFVSKLSDEKGRQDEFSLYTAIERLAPEVISQNRKMYKNVSANVDFYSGFAYSMLGLPIELYTPIFAIARVVGWSAHRMEELINGGKIIRPAYMNVKDRRDYTKIDNRNIK